MWCASGRLIAYAGVNLDDELSPGIGIHVLDAETGDAAGALGPMRASNNYGALSRDGRLLVSYGWEGAQVWNLNRLDGTVEALAFSREGTISAAAFSPDGRYLALGLQDDSAYTGLVIYDLEEPLQTLAPQPEGLPRVTFIGLAWSPNGHTLAAISDDSAAGQAPTRSIVRLFYPETMTWIAAAPPIEWDTSIVFNPDASLIAVAMSASGIVRLYDAATLEPLADTPVVNADQVAFSPDGTLLVTGGWDGIVRLWGVP